MVWMYDQPSRINLGAAVLPTLGPDTPIDGDDIVRYVGSAARTHWSPLLHRTWAGVQVLIETLRLLLRERYKEPLTLALDAPWHYSFPLFYKLRFKRFVRLRNGISDLNLRYEEMDIVPSAEVPAIELRRPQFDTPVVASLSENAPARRVNPFCDGVRALEGALFYHFDVRSARFLHAQNKLNE